MKARRRGYILLQAIIVLAGLMSLVVILASDGRQANDAVQNRLDQRRSDQAANAAVARAMCVLATANPDIVTLSDDWAQQGSNGDDQFTFSATQATYRLQIIDAGSLLNVNAIAGAPMSPAIPSPTGGWADGPLAQLPLEQNQIDSLLDWVSTSTTATSDGAKDEYYNNLPQPYNTKLGPLSTVDELLLVDNWTAQTLYQPLSAGISNSTATAAPPTDTAGNVLPLASMFTVDSSAPNTQASGSPRTYVGSVGAAWTALGLSGNPPGGSGSGSAPIASFSDLFASPLLRPLLSNSTGESMALNTMTFLRPQAAGASSSTTGSAASISDITGRININTATQAVLETVPNVTTTIASSIVSQQSSGFQTFGALATDAVGFTSSNELGQASDYFTIGSDTWILRAYGECGRVGTALEVVVRVSNGQVQVINWNRLNTTGIPTWWDWTLQPSSTIDAGDSE